MVETINVVKNVEGRFGPQVLLDNGKYASFGKFFKGDKQLNPGSYQVDVFVTDKGNMYINEVLETLVNKPIKKVKKSVTPETPVVTTTSAPETAFKVRDFDKENRGKVKSLFLEALLGNPNLVGSLEDVHALTSKELHETLAKLVESVF